MAPVYSTAGAVVDVATGKGVATAARTFFTIASTSVSIRPLGTHMTGGKIGFVSSFTATVLVWKLKVVLSSGSAPRECTLPKALRENPSPLTFTVSM